jgi:hypothetical protein
LFREVSAVGVVAEGSGGADGSAEVPPPPQAVNHNAAIADAVRL